MGPFRTEPAEMQVDRDILREPEVVPPSSDELMEQARVLAAEKRAGEAACNRLRAELHAMQLSTQAASVQLGKTLTALIDAVTEGR